MTKKVNIVSFSNLAFLNLLVQSYGSSSFNQNYVSNSNIERGSVGFMYWYYLSGNELWG